MDLALFDPSPGTLPTEERIDRARRAEAVALETPGITNSQGASYGSSERYVLLANTMGFLGDYRASSVSLSVAPQAERDGQMERDHWYTTGRGLSDLEPPEDVGKTAAERTLRRVGARQAPTGEVPVVFDPETAAEILGTVFSALSGYAVFRHGWPESQPNWIPVRRSGSLTRASRRTWRRGPNTERRRSLGGT